MCTECTLECRSTQRRIGNSDRQQRSAPTSATRRGWLRRHHHTESHTTLTARVYPTNEGARSLTLKKAPKINALVYRLHLFYKQRA